MPKLDFEGTPIAEAAELWQASAIERAMAERDRLAGIITRAARYLADVEALDGILARAERRLTETLAPDLAKAVRAAVASASIARAILAEAGTGRCPVDELTTQPKINEAAFMGCPAGTLELVHQRIDGVFRVTREGPRLVAWLVGPADDRPEISSRMGRCGSSTRSSD